MPYLNYLFCEVCGEPVRLDLDYIKTIESYIADGRKTTSIDDRNFIWDYIVYSCIFCHRSYRYTYQDVERRVREHLSSTCEKQKQYIQEMVEAQKDDASRKTGHFFVAKSKEVAARIKKMYSE